MGCQYQGEVISTAGLNMVSGTIQFIYSSPDDAASPHKHDHTWSETPMQQPNVKLSSA